MAHQTPSGEVVFDIFVPVVAELFLQLGVRGAVAHQVQIGRAGLLLLQPLFHKVGQEGFPFVIREMVDIAAETEQILQLRIALEIIVGIEEIPHRPGMRDILSVIFDDPGQGFRVCPCRRTQPRQEAEHQAQRQ